MSTRRGSAAVGALLVVVLTLVGCGTDGDGSSGSAAAAAAAATAAGACTTVPVELPAELPAGSAVDGGGTKHSITSGGVEREYAVWLPADYDGAEPLPVVADFHGAGGEPVGFSTGVSTMASAATERGYLVVAPQAATGTRGVIGWQPEMGTGTDDVGLVRDLLTELSTRYCVDRERVYATGFSSGAGMSSWLACELPELAAVAPVTGVNLHRPCPDGPPMPVLSFHGDVDEYVFFTGVPALSAFDGTGPFIGDVSAVLESWAQRNGCSSEYQETPAEGSVVRTYDGCPEGAEVVLHVLTGAKHFYPGGGANQAEPGYSSVPAPELILDFFDAH